MPIICQKSIICIKCFKSIKSSFKSCSVLFYFSDLVRIKTLCMDNTTLIYIVENQGLERLRYLTSHVGNAYNPCAL